MSCVSVIGITTQLIRRLTADERRGYRGVPVPVVSDRSNANSVRGSA